MSSQQFDEAEAFFEAAWERDQLDRDFSGNADATSLYGEPNPNEVPHFKFPVKTESGDAYVYQSIPIRLFADRYRRYLEESNRPALERIENAIDVAEEDGRHDDVRILAGTRDRLQL